MNRAKNQSNGAQCPEWTVCEIVPPGGAKQELQFGKLNGNWLSGSHYNLLENKCQWEDQIACCNSRKTEGEPGHFSITTEGTVYTKMNILSSVYSPLCWSKTVWLFILLILKNVCNQTVLVAIDFHCIDKNPLRLSHKMSYFMFHRRKERVEQVWNVKRVSKWQYFWMNHSF